MKLIAQVKLNPTPEQHAALLATLAEANAACDAISAVVWQAREFRRLPLQKLVYHDCKSSFRLGAQVLIRCIAKVADAYKLDRKTQRRFKPHGALAFDDRNLMWYTELHAVSIWALSGRQYIPYSTGKQRRFQKDTNHRISKRLVAKAKDTKRAIALEDLTHMRTRTTVRKSQRARHSNWAFAQLRTFIGYKAQLAGIPVVLVDPRKTSQLSAIASLVVHEYTTNHTLAYRHARRSFLTSQDTVI